MLNTKLEQEGPDSLKYKNPPLSSLYCLFTVFFLAKMFLNDLFFINFIYFYGGAVPIFILLGYECANICTGL